MLFRTTTGELIQIKKYDFSNDKLYYQKIMDCKKPYSGYSTKLNKVTTDIKSEIIRKNFSGQK
jgi:hypothetical protein